MRRRACFVTLASGFDDDDEALPIRAQARVLGATLKVGETVDYALGKQRHGYLVPASGAVEVNGVRIDARDGAAIKDVGVVKRHPAFAHKHPGLSANTIACTREH